MNGSHALIAALARGESLPRKELTRLIAERSPADAEYAARLARETALREFGRNLYLRGLIEFTSFCKNDCLYCGLRRSNRAAGRYRLSEEEILLCCRLGYEKGLRTFVLQGGEDPYFTDERIVSIVRGIKAEYPDCAVTLSLGERPFESYRRFREAGADRYLLRHETANPLHYARLHPPEMSWENRVRCLRDLISLGFQTGCGMMVGSPYQTPENLAEDLLFMRELKPQMIGLGPFLPHRDTPFRDERAGSAEDTLFLLSLVRLMHPKALLPATTALGTLLPGGRERGILAGANVVMPNISPEEARAKYLLYNNKLGTAGAAADNLETLRESIRSIGYRPDPGRGDYKGEESL